MQKVERARLAAGTPAGHLSGALPGTGDLNSLSLVVTGIFSATLCHLCMQSYCLAHMKVSPLTRTNVVASGEWRFFEKRFLCFSYT